ncbi:MAG: cysteine--tRNA ligase, partial [Planctomycetota bacterium]
MKIYNSFTQQKEEFKSSDPVKMYVCGVTTYSACHIGHAMSYIVFDTIRRYLEYRGHEVKHVQNFTDIDDKIIANANLLGVPAQELSEGLIDNFFADMDALNIQRAHIYPKVTEEIPDIINIVERLIEKKHAYQSGGDVYFRVKFFPGYGKLSHRSMNEMVSGDQGQYLENKEHPMDFALWKSAKPGEPEWDSPWGKGRPGWHIECSAMSLKYLGETLDIHGGGQDLVFPHHENEIAQSEAYTGTAPFARYWMHNGLLQFEKEKMSKSLGNLITIKEALNKFGPDALRLFVLSSHYRSPLTYTEENVAAMSRGVQRLRQAAFSDDNATKSD